MKTIFRKCKCILVLFVCMLMAAPTQADTWEQFQVLVYTSPDMWHDQTIPFALTELKKMAKRHTFGLTWAQRGGVGTSGTGSTRNALTDEHLAQFEVVIFLNTRGRDLSEEQMESFKKYIRNGGGFVAIHNAIAGRRQDPWYQELKGVSKQIILKNRLLY